MILEINEPEALSNSNFNLFNETKAISIPEKKAENNNVTIITVNVKDILKFWKIINCRPINSYKSWICKIKIRFKMICINCVFILSNY